MQNVKDYYDEIPYFSAAFADCSPLRLEAIGRFLGLNTAKSSEARVLELGCSYGGNILPFAVHNERANVVGIDISSAQVDEGNAIASQMGIVNFKLLQKDILSLAEHDFEELGKFDYIIAHGLYSWVNKDVKEALMRCVRALLADSGIAYISYNVYPGWKSFDILRDFMLFASSEEKGGAARLKRAKEELNFLQNYLKFSLQNSNDKVYKDSAQLLLTQAGYLKNIMKDENDYYILHDFLEASNDPTYLYKFVEHARKHGLCYLTDCNLDDVFRPLLGIYRFDTHIEKNYKSRVQKEQMRDFLLNRSFRKSLVMKREILNGAQDFDAQIGLKEISTLNFILRSNEEGGSAVYNALKNAYPSSLNFTEILEFTGLEAGDALEQLIEVFAVQKTSVAVKPFKVSRAANRRLKARVAGYLSYFANTSKPVILAADELNLSLNLSQDEARTALKFDGRSVQSIVDELEKEGAINAKELVEGLEAKLEAAFFFEENLAPYK